MFDLSEVDGTLASMADLTDEHRAILDFERYWWRYQGAKDAAIRERFDISPTRYYQALNTLIDQPEALAADPMTVRRLIRLRDQRRAVRSTSARVGG